MIYDVISLFFVCVGEKYGLPRPLYGGVYTAALRKIIRALSRCNATECRWYIQRSLLVCVARWTTASDLASQGFVDLW